MRICAFSDMHGQYDFTVDPCDIVLICGDILPLNIQMYSKESKKWLSTSFIPWCGKLPCEKVVLIAGNHDFYFQRHPEGIREMLEGQDKIIYLDCETYEYDGKVIFGSPWCKPFGRWAFMESYEEQDERYAHYLETINNVDILIAKGDHIGNKSLNKVIDKWKPLLHLHGHLHSTNHEEELLGTTKVYNVSLLNEDYNLVYKPLYIDV